MPIYEYRCPSCGHESEHLQRVDDPAPPCDQEGCDRRGHPMTKRVSRTNFELRGGGWAKDGYGG